MASLTAKVVHGHKYFQIITSRRINGKPRQVVLAHLGTADTLFARLQQKQGEPIKARVQPFGFLAAAWGLAQKLQLVSLIDRHVPKRQQGASVGQYLVLAALNRLTSPTARPAWPSGIERLLCNAGFLFPLRACRKITFYILSVVIVR